MSRESMLFYHVKNCFSHIPSKSNDFLNCCAHNLRTTSIFKSESALHQQFIAQGDDGKPILFFQFFLFPGLRSVRSPPRDYNFTVSTIFGRMPGIEPVLLRPQPGVLPMSYTHPFPYLPLGYSYTELHVERKIRLNFS